MREHAWSKLVRFGFRLLYNELAWSYDLVSWLVSFGEWRDWQRAALPFVPDGRVLEVGHGPGHMLASLRDAGHQVFGLDLSPNMGRLAQKRSVVPLVRGRAQDLPFGAAVFDAVLSTFPTEYIISPETLAAVHRVLKPDGILIFVPEGHLTGTSPFHRFIEWLFHITGQRQGPFAVDDVQHWPLQDQWNVFQQLFDATGFRIIIERVQLARSVVTIVVAQKATAKKMVARKEQSP